MDKQIEALLQDIINLVNKCRDGNPFSKEDNYAIKIKENYQLFETQGNKEYFYKVLEKEFDTDPELYCLIYSVLYSVLEEEEILVKTMELLNKQTLDIFACANIRSQVESNLFRKSDSKIYYELKRKIHLQMTERLIKEAGIIKNYISVEQREKKKVVIITNQLLNVLHAPSRIVCEVCTILQKYYGFEVLLIVGIEEMSYERMEQFWFEPMAMNYIKELNGNFLINPFGEKIKGYQIILSRDNIQQLKALVNSITQIKPIFSWYIGGISLISEILTGITTTIAMPCTNGYAVSEANVMLHYLNSGSDEVKKAEEYIDKKGQKRVHLDMQIDHKAAFKGSLTKKDLGLPEESFVIVIAGNRLDAEITEEFVKIMEQIIEIDKQICFAIIGNLDKIEEIFNPAVFHHKIFLLGYQKDFIEVLNVMDLFLNPPRKGGGGGAVRAIAVGVPVITLGDCDVATTVGKEFVCETEEEIIELVKKYREDSDFYDKQSKKAIENYQAKQADQLPKHIQTMLMKVSEEEQLDLEL